MSELYDRRTTPVVDRLGVVVMSYGKRRVLVFSCSEAQGEREGIVRLWRTLPEAEQRCCHMPSYGLRFYAGRAPFQPVLLLEASLCWQCNNVYLRLRGSIQSFYSTFDRDGPASQRLRDLLTKIASEEPEGNSL